VAGLAHACGSGKEVGWRRRAGSGGSLAAAPLTAAPARRRARRGAALLGAVLLAGGAATAAPAYQPLPGTEILWDRYGVAHVYARSVPDLFYSFGWAQAHSHGNILLRLYAQARGRAAEYYGAEELGNDRWMAINDVAARSQSWLRQQSPEFRANLAAFAAGINAYAAAHPQELSAQARRVLPVSAADVIGHAQRLFQFIYAAPAGVADHLPSDAPALPAEAAGSNGWAIAPSRSASGRAMLLMNPHLAWTPGWSTYYEIQLTAPGIDLYGATQVGLPVLRFVFSDYLGFTHTVNSPNAVTFYRITPAGGGYRFDGRVLPFQTTSRELKIRQPDGSFTRERLLLRTTVQGPVVGERDGAPIAMRVAGLDRPLALEQYWRMATAHDFAGFQAALRRLQVPTFNVMYADRDGHIEYLYNGLVPRHAFGDLRYWSSVVPGDSSKTLWSDYLRYDELPKLIDPPAGTVQNSNDPPWDAAWPQVLDPSAYADSIAADRVSLRMARGIRMLSQTRKISFDELISDKWSHRSELADRVLPELLEACARYGDELASEAAQVLAHWDRSTDADSRGALLFLAWADQPGAVSGYAATGFARAFELSRPLSTPAGLADPPAAVRALEAAARDTLAHYGALDRPWGEVMRLKLGAVDLPASGGPGRLGVFDVIDFAAADHGTRSANFGASYVALVSFDQPARAKVLLSYGSSSQPGSPHASDQLPLLARQQLRDAWRTRAAVEANLESRDRLQAPIAAGR
jgi:acyl-homoserine-lactone acylase